MAFEVHKDLIYKAQIGFREDAGLSSFDPKDPTLPSLPTVEEAIAAIEPSPPYLRCKQCQGKLLRGLQSLICIYCGQYQKKEIHPDPISFNSTTGYRWLLQSLNLNGSERVRPLAEDSGRNRGQSPAEDETTLSELLDLQIAWRDEPEKPETSSDNKTFEHSTSSLNVGTVDLDNFFTGSQKDVVFDASTELPAPNIDDQSKAFNGDQENLNLFENVMSRETDVPSSFDVSGDASSGWDAEFQSADSITKNEDSKLVDHFVGSEADLSAHMDSFFGQMENLNNREINNVSDPLPSIGNDWVQGDLFSSMTQFDSVVQEKGVISDNLNDASSEGVNGDWFTEADWQKSSANDSEQAEQYDLFVKSKDSTSPDNIKEPPLENVGFDWFENTDWQKNTASNTGVYKIDDFFDVRPNVDAVSSSSAVNDFSHASGWFQDNQWQTNASSSIDRVENEDDDSFDEWNDFTSSTVKQDSSHDFWKESSNDHPASTENVSEFSLFPSTTDTQKVDFGNFSKSDLFSGSFSNYNTNDTIAVNNILSEASTANRDANADAEQAENDEITPNAYAATPPKNNVEMLLSQMHDLSFMLESQLSIPSRSGDITSPQK